jgi:hypothetical protein
MNLGWQYALLSTIDTASLIFLILTVISGLGFLVYVMIRSDTYYLAPSSLLRRASLYPALTAEEHQVALESRAGSFRARRGGSFFATGAWPSQLPMS